VEQAAELAILVGPADLVTGVPALVPGELCLVAVVIASLVQVGDALQHPVIALSIVIPLDGDVIREVPALVTPDVDKVRLQLADVVEDVAQGGPALLLLVFGGLVPQESGRPTAKA
jgi:hypothetical protein